MTAPDVTPVVIVGAGPTGLTAATLLAQQGIATVVLERHPRHYPLPRAVHLDGEVYRLLQHLGVAAEFAQISRPARGMRLVDRNLELIAELDRSNQVGSHGWPEANMFDQPDLELMLRKNLAQYPQAQLLTGMEVLRIDDSSGPDNDSVLVVRDEVTREETDIGARYVLGCDGANSLVRASIGAALDDLHFSEKWLVVDVRLDFELDVWDGVHQICDRRNPASFMQIGPRRYRWEFRLPPGDTGVVPYSEDRIRELIAKWISPTEPGVNIIRKTSYTFRARVADRWRRGNTFLLGDAAHSTPPFIGQGMGAGLRDAANLAWKIALVEHGKAATNLLDTYEHERKPHVTNVIRTAVVIGNAMTGGNGRAGGLLQTTLTKLLAIPGVAAVASNVPVPPLGRSALVTGRRPIGTMIPQHRTNLMVSDELLGQGFALIYRQRVDTNLARVAQWLAAPLINTEQPGEEQSSWTAWLKKHKINAALVRPDRVVIATDKSDNASWLPIFGKTS